MSWGVFTNPSRSKCQARPRGAFETLEKWRLIDHSAARSVKPAAALVSGRNLAQGEVHGFAVPARGRDHVVGARGGPADAQAAVAPGDQAARNGVEDLVEDRIAGG